MCKIIKLTKDNIFYFSKYLDKIKQCYFQYSKYLQDDFSCNEADIKSYILKNNHFFWIVLDNNLKFMGFIVLDNFVGNNDILFSAEITTAFEKQGWGIFVRNCANLFFKMCFETLSLYKIKAQIYPDNFRVKTILKDCGFIYESTLFSETVRNGEISDIEVYSLYRNKFY